MVCFKVILTSCTFFTGAGMYTDNNFPDIHLANNSAIVWNSNVYLKPCKM